MIITVYYCSFKPRINSTLLQRLTLLAQLSAQWRLNLHDSNFKPKTFTQGVTRPTFETLWGGSLFWNRSVFFLHLHGLQYEAWTNCAPDADRAGSGVQNL